MEYGFGELDELVLAYATTIHKAQGTEYPAVVIPLATRHYVMLGRNLLYTGVRRAKCLVVVVGQRKAGAMAVRNAGARRRWSKLRELLQPDRGVSTLLFGNDRGISATDTAVLNIDPSVLAGVSVDKEPVVGP